MSAPPPPKKLPESQVVAKSRSSNLELFRIFCMILIIFCHFVGNSGLRSADGPIALAPTTLNSLYLELLGAWGKTGINCFLMITGYFMCTSTITLRKFVKMMGQIYLYRWLIFAVFLISGYESLSALRIVELVMPFWGFRHVDFVSCFIGFWLTIPFLNILVRGMTKRQHELLILLMLTMFSFLGSIPTFEVPLNYVTWFGVIYFIASYIRLYPNPLFDRKQLWGWLTLAFVLLGAVSIVGYIIFKREITNSHFFVSDSNKFLAVTIAVSSFLWFKNMNIKYSKLINAFGAGTFGVLLIHANSDAMRTWLWKDTLDVVGHYSLPFGQMVLFSVGGVLTIFVICNLIDQLRIATVEKWFFEWYDNKISKKHKWIVGL